jgi:hypothetical protein
MKAYQTKLWLFVFIGMGIFFTACSSYVQVISPNPTDATAEVNGYKMDATGHYVIIIVFNKTMDPASVVVKKTLKLHFTKDPNADAVVIWSANNTTARVTTTLTRDDLDKFQPDDHFSLTLVGTDEGNGVVKSSTGQVLDGDYNSSAGGNYVMGFTVLG